SQALTAGLSLASERGTILQVFATSGRNTEELFAVNTPATRRSLRAAAETGIAIEEPPPAADGSIAPNIFALYEQNIGAITPLLAEDLREAEDAYPAEWLHDAFREAVELNKRSWRYIERILRRWEAEGRDDEKHERDSEGQWLARRYSAGKRSRPTRS
ncbi:MAG: DnaD domain-containing protein, partial [Burkholderiales bacterium]